MKFFVDTADTDDIRDLASTGLLDGVTTNPSLIAKTGRKVIDVVAEICDLVDGPVEVACTPDDGTPIPETVIERLAPMSFVRALIHDADGRPINASGRRRHPTTRQKRVVGERDRACVDCGREQLLEFDHVPAYERSGRTLVDELELRCAPCHHRRHAMDG